MTERAITPRSAGRGLLETFGEIGREAGVLNQYLFGLMVGRDATLRFIKLADNDNERFSFAKIPHSSPCHSYNFYHTFDIEQAASGEGSVQTYYEDFRLLRRLRHWKASTKHLEKEYCPQRDGEEITELVTDFFEGSVMISDIGLHALLRNIGDSGRNAERYRRACEQALTDESQHVAVVTADLLDGWRET